MSSLLVFIFLYVSFRVYLFQCMRELTFNYSDTLNKWEITIFLEHYGYTFSIYCKLFVDTKFKKCLISHWGDKSSFPCQLSYLGHLNRYQIFAFKNIFYESIYKLRLKKQFVSWINRKIAGTHNGRVHYLVLIVEKMD